MNFVVLTVVGSTATKHRHVDQMIMYALVTLAIASTDGLYPRMLVVHSVPIASSSTSIDRCRQT